MTKEIRTYRWLALSSYFALFACVLLWQFATGYSEQSVLFRTLFWVVPLLFPMYGMVKGKPYTHAWANFILMWYFLHSLTMLYVAPEQRFWAGTELILTTLAFAGCTLYARHQGRALGLGLKKLKDEKTK
ncbi:DUF2069 domain-containing protein [Pseudidiomarina terrestris]|uniref:DUF2069 domain-containing protein n=1 Tax=Pseudidiomarina terrestris TaxID=2820060 RepID=A0AAW7QWF2_9GAMM|nr:MULTISPECIES: DUF2069 domain-containing protein [unclassified Pseudidiomarina]MDN7124094.1 DUF2069 domain-containing protein [Pseudidiomarina sp. 1APP75-32.1]MDN7127166.1 DUF2069 domain-containing protein [Pseudidiomarina sp. 1APR75-33.1]MDN7128351.1 DUF2069 domain-containing protein [Pseudidiomarina sp. 1APR75-15]MDN7135421.1 DUF2069 domain-containing protein [Pseudidiomarina sp. 1ASP75-5]MDN7138547.1 DUF2069 domain-containing protein [Pseudidiomarina sp. 1ASP75-14]